MPDAKAELPRYRSKLKVWALKIAGIVQQGNGYQLSFEDTRFEPITVNAYWNTKHQPHPGGYYVVYNSGTSFCQADTFEDGYELIS